MNEKATAATSGIGDMTLYFMNLSLNWWELFGINDHERFLKYDSHFRTMRAMTAYGFDGGANRGILVNRDYGAIGWAVTSKKNPWRPAFYDERAFLDDVGGKLPFLPGGFLFDDSGTPWASTAKAIAYTELLRRAVSSLSPSAGQ